MDFNTIAGLTSAATGIISSVITVMVFFEIKNITQLRVVIKRFINGVGTGEGIIVNIKRAVNTSLGDPKSRIHLIYLSSLTVLSFSILSLVIFLSNAKVTHASNIYDNFDNPIYNNSFDGALWESWEENGSLNYIQQKSGVLIISRKSVKDTSVGLVARKYDDFDMKSYYFEAKVKVDSAQDGHLFLAIASASSPEYYSDCTLGHGNKKAILQCSYGSKDGDIFNTKELLVDFGTWHEVGIKISYKTMKFSYYIDGKKIEEYTPTNVAELKGLKFDLDIGIWGESSTPIIGYVDDVKVNEIK